MSNHSFGKEFLKISRIFLNAHSEKEKERKIIGHYPSNHIPTHKCFYVLLVSEKGKMKVKRRKASCCGLCKWHGRRGDPCQCGLLWWQETWERTSRPFKFWRESWCSYLLWAIVPSSDLSCTVLSLSRSQDRGCMHIYEKCLLCLWKAAISFYFSYKS